MNSSVLSRAASEGPVLCIVGWWPTDPQVAGIFIREHIKAIARHRQVVVVYVEVHKSRKYLPTTVTRTVTEHGLLVHRVRIDTPIRRFGVPALLVRRCYHRLVRRLHAERPFDLIHIHVRTNETEQIMPLAKELGLPVILTEHNSFYHLGIRSLPPHEEAAQRRSIRQWFKHRNIVSVMPVSHDLARVLRADFGVPDERITVIPNIAADEFKYAPAPPPAPYRIALASVWRPPKDHDVFIRALALIPPATLKNVRIDWVGFGPDYQHIIDRCERELPEVDIRFPGAMDKSTLAKAMQEAHLFVLPTTADNLPCVVLESQCCGTPVVSMAVNGVPELIDGTNGLLVPPSDPEALAAALVACIQDPDRFDRKRIAGDALSKYSASAVAERILAAYANALARVTHPEHA